MQCLKLIYILEERKKKALKKTKTTSNTIYLHNIRKNLPYHTLILMPGENGTCKIHGKRKIS